MNKIFRFNPCAASFSSPEDKYRVSDHSRLLKEAISPHSFLFSGMHRFPPLVVDYSIFDLKFSTSNFSFILTPNQLTLSVCKTYQVALRLCGSGRRDFILTTPPKSASHWDLFNFFIPVNEDPLVEQVSFQSYPRLNTATYVFNCHSLSTRVEVFLHLRKASHGFIINSASFKCSHFAGDIFKTLGYKLADHCGLTERTSPIPYSTHVGERSLLSFTSS